MWSGHFQDEFQNIRLPSASSSLTNDFLLCQHIQMAKFTTSIVIVENLIMINIFNVWLVCVLLNTNCVHVLCAYCVSTQLIIVSLINANVVVFPLEGELPQQAFGCFWIDNMYIRVGELLNLLSETLFTNVCFILEAQGRRDKWYFV